MTSYRERQVVAPAILDEAAPAARAVFDHVLTTRKLGFLPNMFAIMGRSPSALEAVAAVGEHVRFHSALDADLREMVICEVRPQAGLIPDTTCRRSGQFGDRGRKRYP